MIQVDGLAETAMASPSGHATSVSSGYFKSTTAPRMRSEAEVADGPVYLSTAALQVSHAASVSRQCSYNGSAVRTARCKKSWLVHVLLVRAKLCRLSLTAFRQVTETQ